MSSYKSASSVKNSPRFIVLEQNHSTLTGWKLLEGSAFECHGRQMLRRGQQRAAAGAWTIKPVENSDIVTIPCELGRKSANE
jgi:hypothetical protein